MSHLGQLLITTDQAYADSAWACTLQDSEAQRRLLRTGAGLVLQQEGLVRDLIAAGNRQVRRNLGLDLADRILLRLIVSPEVWWAVHYNLDVLTEELLAEDIEINQIDAETAATSGWEKITLGDKNAMTFVAFMSATPTREGRLSALRAAAKLMA